ncbi:hypothetical protein ACRAWD_18620 [Caulobacter segnis]
MKRFSGFYTGEDPAVPNYDPKLKIIRSMITGSKGPDAAAGDAPGLGWRPVRPDPLLHGARREHLRRERCATTTNMATSWATRR